MNISAEKTQIMKERFEKLSNEIKSFNERIEQIKVENKARVEAKRALQAEKELEKELQD